MKIFIGADHAGFAMKEKLRAFLSKKHEVIDCGAFSYQKDDDYPNYAFVVGESTVKKGGFGILICGSGNGVTIAANKVHGVRAVLGLDVRGAKGAREHNNANVLCLRAEKMSFEKNKKIVTAFLNGKASPAVRHKRRIRKINLYHGME